VKPVAVVIGGDENLKERDKCIEKKEPYQQHQPDSVGNSSRHAIATGSIELIDLVDKSLPLITRHERFEGIRPIFLLFESTTRNTLLIQLHSCPASQLMAMIGLLKSMSAGVICH
jgi:hypothetical protein